jgi:hypothetical protein
LKVSRAIKPIRDKLISLILITLVNMGTITRIDTVDMTSPIEYMYEYQSGDQR